MHALKTRQQYQATHAPDGKREVCSDHFNYLGDNNAFIVSSKSGLIDHGRPLQNLRELASATVCYCRSPHSNSLLLRVNLQERT